MIGENEPQMNADLRRWRMIWAAFRNDINPKTEIEPQITQIYTDYEEVI